MSYINGKKFTFKPGQTVLEAATKAGIYIPTLCTHSELSPFGSDILSLYPRKTRTISPYSD